MELIKAKSLLETCGAEIVIEAIQKHAKALIELMESFQDHGHLVEQMARVTGATCCSNCSKENDNDSLRCIGNMLGPYSLQ